MIGYKMATHSEGPIGDRVAVHRRPTKHLHSTHQYDLLLPLFFSKSYRRHQIHSTFLMCHFSFTTVVKLGVFVTLTLIQNGSVRAQPHNENHLRGLSTAGSVQDSRRLDGGDAMDTAAFEDLLAMGPTFTEDQVRAAAAMVDQFYQKPPPSASWQRTIPIDVNFVIIKDTGGQGMTEGQMNAQMDILNSAFYPDFEFQLKTTAVVTNDNFFTVDARNQAQAVALLYQIGAAHKRGGKETLNVYANHWIGSTGAFSRPSQDYGTRDGVFLEFTTAPQGGHWFYNQGKVSCATAVC
jgi:hypothetical protein